MIAAINDIFGDISGLRLLIVVFDILCVFYVIYRTLLLLKGTRALQMLVAMILIFIGFFASKEDFLDLATLHWILEKFISAFIIMVIVIFQDDIRRALTKIGRNPFVYGNAEQRMGGYLEEVIKATGMLSQKGLGALIVIEREAELSAYSEEAFALDASVNKDLLFSIFLPSYGNPLHDGAVVIREDRITHAGVFLPLSVNVKIEKTLGTRHRAAIGITEATDALAIVVSEESQTISLARGGELTRSLDPNSLRSELQRIYRAQSKESEESTEVQAQNG